MSACSLPPSPQDEKDAKALQIEREKAMATLINLRGHLCAKVIFVGPEVDAGGRQVNCSEYRDPRKAKTKNNIAIYMVDLRSGNVKLMERG
jgi:hypothetical protein